MGILNITPDSFSDGGRYIDTESAVDHALRMEAEGADFIDLGGESSRPGSEPVTLESELDRIVPVLKALTKKVKIPISIDTTKSGVAEVAVDLGVEIINDISSFQFDPRMADVAAKTGAAVILMHMRGLPKTMQTGNLEYTDLRGEIISFLQERIEYAESKGIHPDQIIIDPGIGFGKGVDDNLRILKYCSEFRALGRPVLIGPSRKAFIGKITGEHVPVERTAGTLAAVTAAVLNGADIIRVHDVGMAKSAAETAYAIRKVSSHDGTIQ